MGNGLFANFGVDVAQLINTHLAPGLLEVTMTMAAAAGSRPTGELSKGPAAGADTPYTGRGFLEDFTPREFAESALIQAGDRKALVVIESFSPVLPRDPLADDLLTAEGHTYRVRRVLNRDPAAATYTLQVRDI
jgi:hypothetical protein